MSLPIVVVGAGPTGLMLAGELHLGGADVVVLERRADQSLEGSRSGGLHARTMEVLDQRGIVDRFLDAGESHPSVGYGNVRLDITDFPSRHARLLALWQRDFEPLLAAWVEHDLGVGLRRDVEVIGLRQNGEGVDVELADGEVVRGLYAVGCDGGRSRVRQSAGIDFPGWDASTSWMLAEVEFAEEPQLGFHHDEIGQHAIGQRPDRPGYGLVLTEPDTSRTRPPSDDEIRAALVSVYGSDFGMTEVHHASYFTDVARQAATYRTGRVLLAGDAAHIHPPQGGQGLNVGVQDAVNLGWKLARVARGLAPDELLDSYHDERHPVGTRVIANTLAQVALTRSDDRHQQLQAAMAELLTMDEPRRHLVGMLSGLDIAYDLDGDHPMVGRRVPDLDLIVDGRSTRVFELLHPARPLLLDLRPDPIDPQIIRDDLEIDVVPATTDAHIELPVLGRVDTPAAVLVRPDGHVSWVGEPTNDAITNATASWVATDSAPQAE